MEVRIKRLRGSHGRFPKDLYGSEMYGKICKTRHFTFLSVASFINIGLTLKMYHPVKSV